MIIVDQMERRTREIEVRLALGETLRIARRRQAAVLAGSAKLRCE